MVKQIKKQKLIFGMIIKLFQWVFKEINHLLRAKGINRLVANLRLQLIQSQYLTICQLFSMSILKVNLLKDLIQLCVKAHVNKQYKIKTRVW